MPREYHQFTNSVLVPLALHGDYEAIRERLVREVRNSDNVCFLLGLKQGSMLLLQSPSLLEHIPGLFF